MSEPIFTEDEITDPSVTERVNVLFAKIAMEKKEPFPDKSMMKEWIAEIINLKGDWRVVHGDWDNKFLMHTSQRSWENESGYITVRKNNVIDGKGKSNAYAP